MKYIISLMFMVVAIYAKGVSDNEIGLRKTPLNSENLKLEKFSYPSSAAGESKVIERSFENAPPMIPHDVDGLMEITRDYNACLDCHLPSVASLMGATSVPQSHLYNLRSDKQSSSSNEIDDSRYNCNLCHVPQANAKLVIGNNFKPDFRNKDLKNKSNLLDVINEGVK